MNRERGFVLTEKEWSRIKKWQELHNERVHNNTSGLITYSFTPTGIGIVTVAVCRCGETLDLTAYEEW